MIIIFEGPEKAGKSTLISALADELKTLGYTVVVRKWGPAKIDDREYADALQEDTDRPRDIILWDRGWVSEHVYAKLLNRPRRLADDPWLGEWLHRRAVDPCGLKYIVIPKNADSRRLEVRRDKTDLPVDPFVELAAFINYGTRFHWSFIQNGYNEASLKRNINDILDDIVGAYTYSPKPPYYAGPSLTANYPGAVFIEGKSFTEPEMIPGGWLPFSSPSMIKFARQLGDEALGCGWAAAGDLDPKALAWVKEIVVLGHFALEWVQDYVHVKDWQKLTILPDPKLAKLDYTLQNLKTDFQELWR